MEERPDGHLCWVTSDGADSESEVDQEDNDVPPLGNLGVDGHEFEMDVIGVVDRSACLVPDLLSVVEEGVNDGGAKSSKRQTVRDGEGGAEHERRVRLVCFFVERGVGVDDLGDVVLVAKVVVRGGRREWQVAEVEGVGVVEDGAEEPDEEEETSENVRGGPPRGSHWVSNTRDLSPIKGQNTHTST
jgi:hypothetical protein